MSHLKQRKETNCLNCNAEVAGRFCSLCGQENTEPAESAWHLVTHFFNDITHFEGKFFRTLKLLFTKPGFLANEYRIGRRASYMNPVRLYVFTSFVFFLISFGFFSEGEGEGIVKLDYNGKTAEIINAMDSADFAEFTKALTKDSSVLTRAQFEHYKDTVQNTGFSFLNDYRSTEHYDSLVKKGEVTDSWLGKLMTRRALGVREKYAKQGGSKSLFKVFGNKFVHSFPQMLFVSLPLFALFLLWLYYRHKQFFYVSHGVFAIYLYVFLFLMILLIMFLNAVKERFNLGYLVSIPVGFLYPGIFYYQYKSMRNFYGQGRGKTILKMFLLNSWLTLITILLFTLFSIFIFFKL
ncbi:MAG: DUF3667 domain-containing protein [Ferruginibacter sp.]